MTATAPIRILFTRGLSSTAAVVASLREDMAPGEFVLHASHPSPAGALESFADRVHPEPRGADDAAHLAWLTALCERERIDLVWPQSRIRLLLDASLACQDGASPRWLLPVPSAEVLERIEDKAAFLSGLETDEPDIPLPAWRQVRNGAEFRDARAALRETVAGPLCIKPARGIYGSGFRILDATRTPYRRWLDNDILYAADDEIAALLDANPEGRTFLLMEYLPGAERSLDCLARRGELLACVVRRKGRERWQLIEDHPPSQALARRLCARFGLHGVINIQTRESAAGVPGLLEINPRLSGGIDQCRAGGCNLPLAALRMALDRLPSDWSPAPAQGARVGLLERGARF